MSKTETSNIGFFQKFARKATIALVNPVARSETTDTLNSLDKANEHLRSGKGLIVIINHFSRKDPEQAVYEIFHHKVMKDKKIIAPIARHMDSPIYHFLGKFIDVDLKTIVTKNTLEKEKYKNLQLNDGMIDYTMDSIKLLKKGGIVVLAPQGTRMPNLGESDNTAVAKLMLDAKRKGLSGYGFLFIGFGIKGETDYSKPKGLNLNKTYTIHMGDFLREKDVLSEAENDYRKVDKVIYSHLSKFVPKAYRNQ